MQPGRRRFVRTALLPVFGALVGREADAQETLPDMLPRRFIVGEPEIPPLDTSILFAREGAHETGGTVEVLSLIQDEKGENCFPWTVYAQLRTKHRGGDAVGYYARLYKDGPGWSAGMHSEVFSQNWGVGIGVNIEVANQYEGDDGFNGIIGCEMQSLGPRKALAGLQVEGAGGYETQIRLRGEADTGIDVVSECGVGINLRENSLRLSEGSCIELDAQGEVKLRYTDGHIEFLNGDRRIAHIPVDTEDHAL